MSTVVLDVSALLALLRGEAGASKVEGALGDACMSAVSMAEVVSCFHRLGMPPDLVDQMPRPLPVTLVPAGAEPCWEAGLALAKRDKLPAWAANKTWKDVADAAEVRAVLIR